MVALFSEHEEGCTPLLPCRNCQAVAFVKLKLSGKDFSIFAGLCGVAVPAIKTGDLDRPLTDFEWAVRTGNCLKASNIETVGQLIRQTEESLLRIPNFGRSSLAEVREVLASIGHNLGELPYEPRVVGGSGT